LSAARGTEIPSGPNQKWDLVFQREIKAGRELHEPETRDETGGGRSPKPGRTLQALRKEWNPGNENRRGKIDAVSRGSKRRAWACAGKIFGSARVQRTHEQNNWEQLLRQEKPNQTAAQGEHRSEVTGETKKMKTMQQETSRLHIEEAKIDFCGQAANTKQENRQHTRDEKIEFPLTQNKIYN
jgi:hypothetical protein